MRKRKHRRLALLLGALLAVLTGCAAPTEQDTSSDEPVSNPDSEAIAESATTAEQAEVSESAEATEIVLDFEGNQVAAVLDNSETTQGFLTRLPLTVSMSRYGDREYYAAIPELPENGEEIPDFENGDITYYTTGKSLAIFFGNADSSSQADLIRMGRITSDLEIFQELPDTVDVTIALAEGGGQMPSYDFTAFSNVELSGIDTGTLSGEELAVLYQQARYCQAMTEADTETMRQITSEDAVFTHMSGKQQTREEYFADIENGNLVYYTIGMENPVVEVHGNTASVTYTSVLNANAYGARGTYRMAGTHWFELRNGQWISVNAPENQEENG